MKPTSTNLIQSTNENPNDSSDTLSNEEVVTPSFLKGGRKKLSTAATESPGTSHSHTSPAVMENIETKEAEISKRDAEILTSKKEEPDSQFLKINENTILEKEEEIEEDNEEEALIPDSERIIGSKILRQMIPLSMMQIWRLEQLSRFPARIQISSKKIGWNLLEVKQHIAGLPRGSNSNSAPQPKIGGKNAK
jgi:predicted DNA-binding transcriptional regulator AlpA